MAKKLDPSEIVEVQEFIAAEHELSTFREEHSAVFEKFDELAVNYNQKLEAADKVVRAKQVSCGPWDLYQEQVKYDAKILFESVGRERFISVGGTMETQTIYGVDKSRIEASINQGLIPTDVAAQFRSVSPRFHKPNKVDLP